MMTYKPITELSIEEWDQVMNVNVRAVFLLSKFCLPHMKKGAMVNVSSVHAHDTTPNVTPYAASKGALEAFMFATGIENSYPTIQLPDGSRKRIDSMEKSGQYRRWREDFDLVKGLALDFLRYGPPYYRVHRGPGQYDWDRNIRPVGTAYRQLVADCKALLGGKSYGIHLNA